ncbi:MAG TPA: isoprenylcysteine carboxylmethyltransferase family protein [Oligoflexus sp.]|uniref:isoprenylcysteine carboxylmethyltransferase family protein n=1 Tax=Oligoflexus sp. TaxID=1971216 RepID=UPI002D46771F|nr:isoprenylcysteine carboxylmethyltransferase family protein [Oligoflexus sp.]HYX35016.1 isoprenylcysteine carboxylmethyltransferase family protein [Oligoflexus sp.]
MAVAIASLPAELPAVLVLVATALVTYGERRVHGYNYAYLKVVGGEELIPELMKRYYQLQMALPLIAWLSHFTLPHVLRWTAIPMLGLGLLMASMLLRVWSMRSLGRLWTQRCVFVPGMPRSDHGPYRFMRHPEYAAHMLEGLGLLLFFGANPLVLGLWFWNANNAAKICKIESRQLYELSVAPLQMPEASSTVGASD